MALEFEKLRPSLDQMANVAAARRHDRRYVVDELLALLHEYAVDWPRIARALAQADADADPKHYRAARPISDQFPLDKPIDAPPPPPQATIVATDGSQIMPDRHAAHLYYLINIGGIVYWHGDGRSPDQFTVPELHYPKDESEDIDFLMGSGGKISIERDKQEIRTLANTAWNLRDEASAAPLLALLDQRLLYWPIGGPDAAPNEDVIVWLNAMTKARDGGALLAGYIDRPMTGSVVTLLRALQGLDDEKFDWKELGKRSATGGLTDTAVYSRLLAPGQRSPVFVYVSPPNRRFAEHDPENEVCFFYLNPARRGRRVARIDIPRWVAEEETAVAAVHALIIDQCRILGDYPYVIARADEMAVVGHRDHEELDFLIDLYMQRHGIAGQLAAKQSSKGVARGGKSRHEGV